MLLEADNTADLATAQAALERASEEGELFISPVVYAELLAGPTIEEAFLETFLQDTHIRVEWRMKRQVWKRAAHAYRDYAAHRRQQKGDQGPRRILADFLIGAHAQGHGARLQTFDSGIYRRAFPELSVVQLEA